MENLNWRKSSYSSGNGGECVEVADHGNRILVRDTTDRIGPMLRFTPGAWQRFADQVKRSLASHPLPGVESAQRLQGALSRFGALPSLCRGCCGSGVPGVSARRGFRTALPMPWWRAEAVTSRPVGLRYHANLARIRIEALTPKLSADPAEAWRTATELRDAILALGYKLHGTCQVGVISEIGPEDRPTLVGNCPSAAGAALCTW